MAIDANTIVQNLLAGTGYGRTPNDYRLQNQQIQGNDQQLQIGKMQLSQATQDQAQQEQYSQDVSDWEARASPPSELPALAIKYPKQYQAIRAGWDLKDKAQQTADLNFFGQAYAAANNGRSDLAKQQLVARRDAEKEAGIDTSELDDLIGQFDTDPKAATGTLKSVALAHIYAGDKDGFAKAFGLGSDKTHVITAGGALVDDSGKELYKADTKPDYQKVDVFDEYGTKIGEKIVRVGGGDGSGTPPATGGGGATAGRTTGGWTPRARNGGDNSDAAVDGKISGASQFLGVSPEDDVTQLPPLKIAQAMALSEGGPGSLADRNNNPANMRKRDGTYMKFATPQAGLNAAAALVKRKLANGQTTVRTLIEGLPAAGSADASSAQGGGSVGGNVVFDSSAGKGQAGNMGDMSQTGDAYLATLPQTAASQVKALADGRLPIPSGFALSKPYWQKMLQMVAQYDPTFDAANAQTRVKTRKEFTSGKAAANITSFNTVLHHIDTLQHAADDLNNWSIPLVNTIGNSISKATGGAAVDKFNSAKQAVIDELERSFRGTSGTLEGIKGWEKTINSSSSPDQIKGVLTQMADLLAGRVESLGEQYTAGMGKSVDPINLLDSKARAVMKRLATGYGDEPVKDAPTAAGAASPPIHVATMAQARALPSGTKFVDPHGVTRVVP